MSHNTLVFKTYKTGNEYIKIHLKVFSIQMAIQRCITILCFDPHSIRNKQWNAVPFLPILAMHTLKYNSKYSLFNRQLKNV